MSAIDSYAKRLAPAGSLIGISTIHFVRWLLIDDGRRLMMVSDYDGSWESYIDEFAELILSGLDAIWETSYGYPPDGARDLPAFKRFLRSHQVPSEVFYSAYPGGDGAEYRQRSRVRARLFGRSSRSLLSTCCGSCEAMTPRSARLTDDVLADIQGFITSGYGHLSHAAYLFVQFHDAGQARRWLRRLAPAITSARPWPIAPDGGKIKPPVAMNIAFGAGGLAAIGLPPQVLCTFPPEFQEGIASPDRSRVLGDTEESDPVEWELGGTGKPPIHAVLVVHAASEAGLEAACRAQRTLLDDTAGGVVELPGSMQSGYRPDGDHEPFGFHDGIAQPSIAGIAGDGVPTGEFILGYQNHFQIVPPTPVVPAELDPGRSPASAGESLSRIAAAARSRHQRLLRRVPQAPAGRRGVLAVHETRGRSNARARRTSVT